MLQLAVSKMCTLVKKGLGLAAHWILFFGGGALKIM